MYDWLLAPIDVSRAHDVGFLLSWHGRIMVAAWGILIPLGVGAAAAFKVMPSKKWPRELDNQTWWNTHRFTMMLAALLTVVGLVLIKANSTWSSSPMSSSFVHSWMGWILTALAGTQLLSARLRGSKGGPTDPAGIAGDHFDMTVRRRVFEAVHKTTGYVVVILGVSTILTGLWQANAPRWMWAALVLWFILVLVVVFAWRRRRPVSPYQAIWGPDPSLPGNKGRVR